MWWGRVDRIPAGFEICDGSAPTTQGSKLDGLKPDMRDRFPKAPGGGTTDVQSSPVAGGSHTVAERLSLDTRLTVDQLPSHRHPVDITTVGGTHRHHITTGRGDSGSRNRAADGDSNGGTEDAYTDTDGAHSHRVLGNTGDAGLGLGHNHIIPAHDNRPAFLEMFFIIRVR